jgi:molecular chaperone HtpG
MNETEKRKFELHLPGLLKVLAEHLYSTRQVAIRELIQNAHDSCIRRAFEGREGSAYKPRIVIAMDPARKTLIIRDNGFGLTADEIKTYLATIGRSYTRELSERLEVLSPEGRSDLIGQFGLGFLSSFLIASEVELSTKSWSQGSEALQWRCGGDEYYQLTSAADRPVGTEIRLKLKPESMYLLQEQVLGEAIRKYADFLPIPIYLRNETSPINLMVPPWEAKEWEAATRDYISRAFHNTTPLWVMPLNNDRIHLGHDSIDVPLQGFLFIPSSSVASVREYGDLSVYIKHMFICDNERDLLPPWARFVRGVIDSPFLQPTASREGLHQNDNFDAVQEILERQLTTELRSLAENSPGIWKTIVYGHSDVMIGWAVTDDHFFEQIADIVTFRTSRGPLSLSDYLKLTDATLYYVSREMGSLQEQLLGDGYNVPVIDASWFAVKPFLEKYVSLHPEVTLVQMDGQSKQLFSPVSEGSYRSLLAYYQKQGIRARVAAYQPADVPGLILYPKDAEWLTEARDTLDGGGFASPLANFVDEYLTKRLSEMTDDDLQGILYLNASCPFIRRLAENPPREDICNAILDLIYQVARLFAGRILKPAEAIGSFREMTSSLQTLMDRQS